MNTSAIEITGHRVTRAKNEHTWTARFLDLCDALIHRYSTAARAEWREEGIGLK